MSIFDEFDKAYDSKSMKEEVKEYDDKAKEYDELKPGTYAVYVKSMELKATKNNEPMMAVQLKVSDGEHKNKMMFANFMLTKPFLIHKANEFLRSLGSDIVIEFDSYGQYADVIDDVYKWTEEHECDYDVEYSLRDGKYKEYKVVAVYSN